MEWKLESIKIDFKKGYSFESDESKKVDRYEGVIKFEGDDQSKFSFQLSDSECLDYLRLIADRVVKSAEELGEVIAKSIKKQTN